jgi:Zn-dependent protease with chaperone function
MNSKHFNFALFFIYTIVTNGLFLYILTIFGVPISPFFGSIFILVWISYCYWVGPYMTTYSIFRHFSIRKPTLAEEEILNELFSEVHQRSRFRKKVRLFISESEGFDAFATGEHTIAVSKSLLEKMSVDEIRAVLAHELGHLESLDARIGSAYITASAIPFGFYKICLRVRRTIANGCFLIIIIFGFWGFLFIVIAGQLISHKHGIKPLIIIPIYLFILPLFERMVNFCLIANARYREYRQDAYAYSLGYGKGLLSVLHKLTVSGKMEVNRYMILTTHNHPIIYNRIRRLERLLGLREKD